MLSKCLAGYESDKPRDRLIVENGTKISHAYLVSTLNWLGFFVV